MPYDRNSDYRRSDDDTDDVNACHRAQAGAYPQLVTLPGDSKPVAQLAAEGTASFHSLACTGATTASVSPRAVNSPPIGSGSVIV